MSVSLTALTAAYTLRATEPKDGETTEKTPFNLLCNRRRLFEQSDGLAAGTKQHQPGWRGLGDAWVGPTTEAGGGGGGALLPFV